MENQTPQDAPNSTHETDRESTQKKLPSRKIFFTLALVLIVIGMYAGTFYKITTYGP